MLSYPEALKTILDNISVLDVEEKETFNCSGQILMEDIRSDFNIPPADTAARD